MNTKSSTETEIVGLFDKTSDILWTCNFLEAQGYTITANYVYQDNMSTLSLAKNGRVLSSKCTKHIKAKYFFIKHYHHSGKIDLQYCPPDNIWADVLTKTHQGSKFRVIREFLMNCPVEYSEDSVITKAAVKQPLPVDISMKPQFPQTATSLQECVETKYLGTTVPRVNLGLISVLPDSKKKKVTWKDSLFPRHKSLPSIEPL